MFKCSFIKVNDLLHIEKIGESSLPIYFNFEDLINIFNDNEFYLIKVYKKSKNKSNLIVGFLIAKLYENKRVHIMSIAIDKNYRRRNLGTKLINYLKNNINHNKISLYVLVNNFPAIKLYEKNNFYNIKKIENYYETLEVKDAYYYEYINQN